MSLTRGGGPLAGSPAGVANLDLRAHPGHALYWEPHRRHIRGVVGGETLLEAIRITGHVAFHPDRVELEVDPPLPG